MGFFGEALLKLGVDRKGFDEGLSKAEARTEKFGGRVKKTLGGVTGAFGKAQKSIQATAGKVPIVGGALAGLATPAGLATAGIGLVVGGLTKMVSKTLDVGRRLGEMREKLNVGAEAIQIYERAIEETNGKTDAFGATTLRLQKSIGDAASGNKAARAQFDALGLSWDQLSQLSPEEAMKAVVGAANDSLSPTDKASVLSQTLGRSYADLGGFANMTTAELDALLDGVKDTAVTMSGDGVTAVDEYDAANRSMRDSLRQHCYRSRHGADPRDYPAIRRHQTGHASDKGADLRLHSCRRSNWQCTRISASINIASALLRGDFTGALNHAREFLYLRRRPCHPRHRREGRRLVQQGYGRLDSRR